jgi:hypothetical protein
MGTRARPPAPAVRQRDRAGQQLLDSDAITQAEFDEIKRRPDQRGRHRKADAAARYPEDHSRTSRGVWPLPRALPTNKEPNCVFRIV